MKAILELTEARVKVRIEQIRSYVTKLQADLDPQLEQFREMEKDFNEWKKKIEDKQNQIAMEREELEVLEHFDKFKGQIKMKPVKLEPALKKQGKILKNIKWSKLIVPILTKEDRFIEQWELFRMTGVEDTKINRSRFYAALSKSNERKEAGIPVEYYRYKDRVGLPEWNVISHAKEVI